MSILDRLQFYFMHFMPYPDIASGRGAGQWVDIPNAHFDPIEGNKLYKRYPDELVLGDELGYDGLVVTEHHSTYYSLMPSCTVAAGALVARTKRVKICLFGTPIALTYPHRLAEEYAMLDVMSGGRVECAFPLGTGMEYWVNPVNPSTARERFREAMDVLMQAWTQPGPTRYDGRFYQYKYLNPFPPPYQKPHPKIYIVGSGSEETIAYAAEKGFGYSQVFVPLAPQLKSFQNYREIAARHGLKVDSESIIISAMVYVAETEQKAIEEGRDHILFYFQKLLKTSPHFYAPPGHLPIERLRKRLEMPNIQDTEITLGSSQHPLSNRARNTGAGRRTDRLLVRAGAKQQDHPPPARRRHAALEGGQEHHDFRGRSDPASPANGSGSAAGRRIEGRQWTASPSAT
ncbi:MAG: LLM class flavin-dependent oxidoreductase [Rhizobiales bacterium]|nr:LLM class flavin-dependent oxidoreductase [Hyphomicrobiales bacterium]